MHGKVEKNLAMQAQRSGEPLPDFILNAPELQIGLDFYIQAFFDLDTERVSGMGPGPIPFFKVVKYANEYGLDDEQKSFLIYHMREMDHAHLKRVNEELAKKSKLKDSKSNGKNSE